MDKHEAKTKLANIMEKFIGMACKRLPDDVYAKLKELREREESEVQKVIYDTYFDNLDKALKLNRPACQDTGLLHFYINCGSEFKYIGIVDLFIGLLKKEDKIFDLPILELDYLFKDIVFL